MKSTIVRLEQAALHKGVGLLYYGRTQEVAAQVPFHEIAGLLGHRKAAFYCARVTPQGSIDLSEEVPEEQVK